jgi:hypothetical protein
MRYPHRSRLYSIAFVLAACLVAPVAVQTSDFPRQLPQDQIVTGAPYSADQITTVRLTTFGTLIENQVVARIYRDSAGRVRREQAVGGSEMPGSSDRSELVVVIVDPVAGVMYTLNPATRTAYRTPIDRGGAARSPAQEESLGTREFDGLVAIGRRAVVTLPGSQAGSPPVELYSPVTATHGPENSSNGLRAYGGLSQTLVSSPCHRRTRLPTSRCRQESRLSGRRAAGDRRWGGSTGSRIWSGSAT